jgi:hypothetical protein
MNKDYIVSINRVAEVTLPVEVKATSEEEAERLALEIAEKQPSHYWDTLHCEDIDKDKLYVEGVSTIG